MDTQTPKWWPLDDSDHISDTLAMPVPGGLVLRIIEHATDEEAAPSAALCFVPCSSANAHQWLVRASQGYRNACAP